MYCRATPADRALAVAERVAGHDAVTSSPSGLSLTLPASSAPEVTRALVAEGLDVYEVAPVERSLEDVFFEMTSATEEVPA